MIALTGGSNAPAARFRLRQYIPYFAAKGIETRECTARFGAWPPRNKALRPGWAAASLMSRVPCVLNSYRFDVVFIQRELLSTYVTLEPLAARPRIFDVDDAIWLHPRGQFAGQLAALSDSVVCGNDYLAEYFSRWNRNIAVVPTAVDTQRFHPCANAAPANRFVIGWTGTSSNFPNLYTIEPALAAALKHTPRAVLRVVADRPPRLRLLPPEQVEYIPWSTDNEVATIQEMHVGIMPLDDTPFNRGKCSYKMLLYMACGVPVVVSPVGMNKSVLQLGLSGFSATCEQAWIDALMTLTSPGAETMRAHLAQAGRGVVEQWFSIPSLGSALAAHLRSVALGSQPVEVST